MKIFILPKLHFSLPFRFRTGKNINWKYEITINKSYNHNSEDQQDFNKLIGIKSSYFNPKLNSIMIGYRWDITNQYNELVFYWHDNGGREWSKVIGVCKPKEKIIVSFQTINNQKVSIEINNIITYMNFQIKGKRWYLINTWFGGNKTSNQLQTFNITKIK